jgi:hypothetical protein
MQRNLGNIREFGAILRSFFEAIDPSYKCVELSVILQLNQ